MAKCKYCGKDFENGFKVAGHSTWCEKNPNVNQTKAKLKISSSDRKHSEETKKKISKIRKEFLDRNPEKVPYILYHSSNKSWPETRFEKVLKDNEITGWVYNYRVGRFSLDFAFPEWMIDVEIDGSTHNLEKVIKSDNERDLYLKSIGWKILRFKASEINKNPFNCVEIVLKEIKNPKKIEIPESFLHRQFEREKKIRDAEHKRKTKKEEKDTKIKEKIDKILTIVQTDENKLGLLKKIAEELKISHTHARRICKKYNIKVFNRSDKKKRGHETERF